MDGWMDVLPKRWRQVAMPGSSLVAGEGIKHWVHDQMEASSRHMRSSQEWGMGCMGIPGAWQWVHSGPWQPTAKARHTALGIFGLFPTFKRKEAVTGK